MQSWFKTNWKFKKFPVLLILSFYLFWTASAFGDEGVRFRADHMILESVTDGVRIFAATQTGKINQFNLKTNQAEPDLISLPPMDEDSFPPTIFSLALSPSRQTLAAGNSLGQIMLFSTNPPRLIKKQAIPGIENVLVVRFLDENRILLGLIDGTVRLIDIQQEKEIYRVQVEMDPVNNIQLSPDRSLMAVTTAASTIKIINTETGTLVQELDGHRDTVYGVTFVGNDQVLSGSKDKKLLLWNLKRGKPTQLYYSDFYINSVAWNGKEKIAFHLPNFEIGIFNLSTRKLEQRLTGHTAFINTLHFINPNTLLSSGNDARIFVRPLQ
ncbi:MAG: hypothetical protein COB67_03485 [SAR324 cluster bacterium]|uniref:Uncharacterized protein n=1 Tax=SAR324 cluster bacterium TaxID=2024889 RepID=A0A2A4T7Q7_9DELT|nr:MAG: hypothetical protein COB67_03485 [SAR324 cluster bacterium]